MPGDAALVELLVAGAVDVLLAVAVPIAPAPVDDPPVVVEPVDEAEEPDGLLAERPPPPVDGLNDMVGGLDDDDDAPPALALLVELVAILSIVAPRPAEPAEAAPVELPVPADVETDTVGALVSVAPEVTVADEPPLLANV